MLGRIDLPSSDHGSLSGVQPFTDNVLPFMYERRQQGERSALVTFVEREGATPRPIGAQMAVSQSGCVAGYISSDCLGDAIKAEALSQLATCGHSLIRFGKGSKYIDLKMPCGSGIDLYFDGGISDDLLDEAHLHHQRRQAFSLEIDTGKGITSIEPFNNAMKNGFDENDDKLFKRIVFPTLRLFIAGTGPAVQYLAQFAQFAGLEVMLCTSDPDVLQTTKNHGFLIEPLEASSKCIEEFVDAFTASAIMFHEHEREFTILQDLLAKNGYYIGAMGSKTVQELRLSALRSAGFDDQLLARIKGPIGALPASKSPPQIATSVLAEILHEAQLREYMC